MRSIGKIFKLGSFNCEKYFLILQSSNLFPIIIVIKVNICLLCEHPMLNASNYKNIQDDLNWTTFPQFTIAIWITLKIECSQFNTILKRIVLARRNFNLKSINTIKDEFQTEYTEQNSSTFNSVYLCLNCNCASLVARDFDPLLNLDTIKMHILSNLYKHWAIDDVRWVLGHLQSCLSLLHYCSCKIEDAALAFASHVFIVIRVSFQPSFLQ